MRESVERVYIAEDGTRFFNEEDCANYEESQIIEEGERIRNSLIAFCERMEQIEFNPMFSINLCRNHNCPFFNQAFNGNCECNLCDF